MHIRKVSALVGVLALATPMTVIAISANATERPETSQAAPENAQSVLSEAPLGAEAMSDIGTMHVSDVRNLSRGSCKYWAMSSHKWAMTWKSAGSCTGHGWVKYRTTGGFESEWDHGPNYGFWFTGSTIKWSKHKSCGDCPITTINH